LVDKKENEDPQPIHYDIASTTSLINPTIKEGVREDNISFQMDRQVFHGPFCCSRWHFRSAFTLLYLLIFVMPGFCVIDGSSPLLRPLTPPRLPTPSHVHSHTLAYTPLASTGPVHARTSTQIQLTSTHIQLALHIMTCSIH
jgi:hypothetical protein